MIQLDFRCPECDGEVIDGLTMMTYELDRIDLTIRNIPAKICSNCGQEFIDGYTAENVNRLIDRIVEDIDSFSRKITRSKPSTIDITF